MDICDRVLDQCTDSEEKCQVARKADAEMITELIKQRNAAIKSASEVSKTSILDIATYIVLGVATGVVMVRGFK